MKVEEIGYLAIDATDLAEWRKFGADYIGFEAQDLEGGCLGLRMDDYAWRFMIRPAERNGLGIIGLKLSDEAALHTVRAEVDAAGFPVHDSTPAERASRNVQHMVWTLDPDGYRVEFFVGRSTAASPFKPGRPIGGFRTGELGFGHVVMGTTDLPAMENFYMKLLGFGLSDYLNTEVTLRFIHTNGRHHSLALAQAPRNFLHHIMVEYKFMDDVGRLYDMAHGIPGMIQTSLGRHDNDHMLSFYSKTPGGFLIETGWGGREIDPATWQTKELWCMSLWGHERSWESPENQAKQRAQKVRAAAEGLLAPTDINDAGGFLMSHSH